MEPEPVILRDASGKRAVQVLEQNYHNDSVSQERLLNVDEGQTIEFSVRTPDSTSRIVTGKIVRSGYIPRNQATNRNGPPFQPNGITANAPVQPVIEVDGKLHSVFRASPFSPR